VIHAPSADASSAINSAIDPEREGNSEMRWVSDREVTATMNVWMNSDEICWRASALSKP
jgi:hypothetical protein